MSTARDFDVVLFGASGFTGQLTAEYLANTGTVMRWALAGRNREKLERVQRGLPSDGSPKPELLLADVADSASMRALAQRGRVVITTVGPYTKYGEPLVAACAELGTDYVDLTGEPSFVAHSVARYHEQAAASRAKIVHACGFDSIPHDLGALFTLRALARRAPTAGETAAVQLEGFVQVKGGFSGGTWQSLLLIVSERPPKTLGPTQLDGRSVGVLPPKLSYRKQLGFWALPMPSIDPLLVCRSAALLPEYGREFRYGHYFALKSLAQVTGLGIGMGSVIALARFAPTRALLAKFKQPGEGPSASERARGFFRVTFQAALGDVRVRCQVRGGDPGYGETAKMLAQSALCLAFDRERLPQRYGVVPSAVAMGDVLIARLQRAGIVFEELPDA